MREKENSLSNWLAAMIKENKNHKVIEELSDAQLLAIGAVEELAEAINRISRGLYGLALKSLDDAIEELRRALDLLMSKKEEKR